MGGAVSGRGRFREAGLILVVALSAAVAGVALLQNLAVTPVSAPAPPDVLARATTRVAAVSSTPPSATVTPATPPRATVPRPPMLRETSGLVARASTSPATVESLVTAAMRQRPPAMPPLAPTARPSATPSAMVRPTAAPSAPAITRPLAGAIPSATLPPPARPIAPAEMVRESSRATAHRKPSAVNVYAATMSGRFNPRVAGLPVRVYVPNSGDGTIDVINPATFQVVDHFPVGPIPHHITPAWDLSRLYVDTEGSPTMAVLDPRTGRLIGTVPVSFAYNLYFTPDGGKAIVVVERYRRLEFRDPHTWRLLKSVFIPWPGVDHLDFSADGRYVLASTEYSGIVVKVDTVAMKMTGWINVGGLPIDVRLAPDGTVFYVANQGRDGVSIIDPRSMKEVGFIPTGRGAHGLEISRDTKSLYVSNRLAGTISVINLRTRRVAATWHIGFSPDMLQLSPDGRQLWVSGRFDGAVYVVDTRTGRILHTIAVGLWPHGLTYFPNAGRFSLGHNGVYR